MLKTYFGIKGEGRRQAGRRASPRPANVEGSLVAARALFFLLLPPRPHLAKQQEGRGFEVRGIARSRML